METNRRSEIGASSGTGAATVTVFGMESGVCSALLVGAVDHSALLPGTGNATLGLFAVALAGTGLLTAVGVIVPMGSFSPFTHIARGTAVMSGDAESAGGQALAIST